MEKFTHGSSGYTNYECRCEICRAGWAARVKDYRVRRRKVSGVVTGWKFTGPTLSEAGLTIHQLGRAAIESPRKAS